MAFTVKVRPGDMTNMIGAGSFDSDPKWCTYEYNDLQWDSVMAVLKEKGVTFLLSQNGSDFKEFRVEQL